MRRRPRLTASVTLSADLPPDANQRGDRGDPTDEDERLRQPIERALDRAEAAARDDPNTALT